VLCGVALQQLLDVFIMINPTAQRPRGYSSVAAEAYYSNFADIVATTWYSSCLVVVNKFT